MKVRIVVNYTSRYRRGHRWNFVPPVTGMHLAALVPREHDVDLVHEQVRPYPEDDWPDVVLLSFFSGFARHAYGLADELRRRGVTVIAGGPHVSYWQEEAAAHVDSVVVGEADDILGKVLSDASRGALERVYRGTPASLSGLPTPRYDLLEPEFVVRRVVQATRGCPFTCSFCTVPDLNPGFRVRPIDEVIRDIQRTRFKAPWQEKLVWFWDDNLLVKRAWAKDLLREMRGLRKWWLTQASIDIAKDEELLTLMEASGCIGIFLGIESVEADALASVDKKQNRVSQYRDAIQRLHDRGICVMAGFISGFDTQSAGSVIATANGLQDIGVDVPFLSILTPFRGTLLYDQLLAASRIDVERDWPHYNGYNVAFYPARMQRGELLTAHRALWSRAFSPELVAQRLSRGARQLRPGAFLLSSAMNGFYGLKRWTGNLPADAPPVGPGRIAHPKPGMQPLRLALAGGRRR